MRRYWDATWSLAGVSQLTGGVVARAADSAGSRWRVFISHTSELRNFPKGTSYVAAVERAISAAGHVIVDMEDFPAADQTPAGLCAEVVRGCDVYVGILGTRYGSPVRDQPEVSYTELEFETATQAGLDRLVFLLDTEAEDLGVPASALIDREFGARQDEFCRRVQDSGLTTRSFSNPAGLGQLVERSLRDLADTRRRIGSGIRYEQVPAEPQPVRASKFVNPPPATAPAWYHDRQVETGLLAGYLTDPGIRLVIVAGRGGVGKTAMVCRLLKELEAGRIPDMKGNFTKITVGGIVYLGSNGVHKVEYPTLVADLLRLLPAEEAQRLQRMYQDPHHSPAEMTLALLDAFPAGEPIVVVLLDNLESVMDTEQETLAEQALHQTLSAVLTAPAHAVTVIATTRVTPTTLLKVEPGRQHEQRLNKGLGSPDAQTVLRELDDDGHLRLRNAPEELLDGLRRYTRGFPRALEAVKAILDGDPTLTPQDLLDRPPLPEDQIVQVLVGEAYELLDPSARQVMQALSVYPAPVPVAGVDFLLQPVNPTTDVAPILTRLARRQLVRFHDRRYHLHPVDRDYARSQLPPGSPGDSPAAFTLAGLQARAADYYAQIRTPRQSWHTLEDVRPQLAEFELRCNTGDYDTAARLLLDIDREYLYFWGHGRLVVDLHERLRGHLSDPSTIVASNRSLGMCYGAMGYLQRAIEFHQQAVAISRDTGRSIDEAANLGSLGWCYYKLGQQKLAIKFLNQALMIQRRLGDRHGEAANLCNLGLCYADLGDTHRAIELHNKALALHRKCARASDGADLSDHSAVATSSEAVWPTRAWEATDLAHLGECYADLGRTEQAIELYRQALTIFATLGAREHTPRVHLATAYLHANQFGAALETAQAACADGYPHIVADSALIMGIALTRQAKHDAASQTFTDAVRAADKLLEQTKDNYHPLDTKALALCGLALVDGPEKLIEASRMFRAARAITRAKGIVGRVLRLFDALTPADAAGILEPVRHVASGDGPEHLQLR